MRWRYSAPILSFLSSHLNDEYVLISVVSSLIVQGQGTFIVQKWHPRITLSPFLHSMFNRSFLVPNTSLEVSTSREDSPSL